MFVPLLVNSSNNSSQSGEREMSLLNIWYPLTALCFSSMHSLCISAFISFIPGSPSSSTHIVHDDVNSISVINMVYYALSNNIALSCSTNTYGNFFSLLNPLFSFYPRRKWVKCLQICRYFPTGLSTDLSWKNIRIKVGISSHPWQYNGTPLYTWS